jgi:hypothetical protein
MSFFTVLSSRQHIKILALSEGEKEEKKTSLNYLPRYKVTGRKGICNFD